MTEDSFVTLMFTDRFIVSLFEGRFRAAETDRILRALHLLDTDERHPSLRVHQLLGDRRGERSASASDELRITFERLADGHKRLLTVSRHYKK